MILTESMLEAAFSFRAAEPWAELTDSDIFAVQTSTGETVYCSIMGHGGEHHSLGIYIGDNGFGTYLKTLQSDGKSLVESLCDSVLFDCINCDFMQAKDIDDNVKKIVRQYAESHGLKIPRKHGWIDFTRFAPQRGQWCITDKTDAMIAEEALRAATFLVNRFRGASYEELGLDPWGKYPPMEGGKQIPFVVANADGTYQILRTTTPPAHEHEHARPLFTNQVLAHRVASLKKSATLECRLLHIPMPMPSDDGEPPVLPGMFLMVDSSNGQLLAPLSTTDLPDEPALFLSSLVNHFQSQDICPKRIIVSDGLTLALLEDFCKKCGIALQRVQSLPDLDEASIMFVGQMMMMGGM